MTDLTEQEIFDRVKNDPSFRAGATAEAQMHRERLGDLGELHNVVMGFAGHEPPPSKEDVVRWMAHVYLGKKLWPRPRVTVKFLWFDLWVGVFVDRPKHTVYICPLPCVVIKVETRP